MPLSPAQIQRLTNSGALHDEEEVSQNPAMAALRFINRPFSAVAGFATELTGDITGIDAHPNTGPLEAIGVALSGKRDYSSIDLFSNLGLDRESNFVKGSALASDIFLLGAFDPLNALTFGTNKLGRIAKAAGKLEKTRVGRVGQGTFGAINFAGQTVSPTFMNKGLAKTIDFTADKIGNSDMFQAMKLAFAGRRGLEKRFPEFAKELKALKFSREEGKEVFQEFLQDFAERNPIESRKLLTAFREGRTLDKINEAGDLIVNVPKRLSAQDIGETLDNATNDMLGEINSTLHRLDQGTVDVLPGDVPRGFADDTEIIKATSVFNARQGFVGDIEELEGRIQDITFAIDESLKGIRIPSVAERARLAKLEREAEFSKDAVRELAQMRRGLKKKPSRALILKKEQQRLNMMDRLHDLQSRSGKLDPGDTPIQEFQNTLRARLIPERDALTKFREAGDGKGLSDQMVKSMESRLLRTGGIPTDQVKLIDGQGRAIKLDDATRHALNEIDGEYDKVIKTYDIIKEEFDGWKGMPIDNYLSHFFPASFRTVFKKGVPKGERVRRLKEEFTKDLLERGMTRTAEVERLADKLARKATGTRGIQFSNAEKAGKFDQLLAREIDFSITGINQADLGFKFEDDAAKILNKMWQDASRFEYAFKANQFLKKNYAKKLGKGSDDFADEAAAKLAGYERLSFEVYGVPADKQPFTSLFVPRDAKKLLDSFLEGSKQITTDAGFRMVLDAAHSMRRWFSAWTLAPFPAFHMRNLAGQFMLMHAGGANMFNPKTFRAFKGSAALMQNDKFGKFFAGGGDIHKALDDTVAEINRLYPNDPNVSPDDIMRLLKSEEVVKTHYRRDIDMVDALEDTPDVALDRTKLQKVMDVVPLSPDITNSKWIRYGFGAGQPIEDVPRAAFFLDRLIKNGELNEQLAAGAAEQFGRQGMSLQDSMTDALDATRSYLFDPTGANLSPFENDIVKTLIPFYQFTRNNIPRQIQTILTEPKRAAHLVRAYNGANNNFAGDLAPEDAPDWIRDELGLPLRTVTDPADGKKKVSYWLGNGWVPLLEVNEVAEMLRGDFGKVLLSKTIPTFKEPIEQIMNHDTFTDTQIRQGKMRDVFGIEMPDWAAHIVRNIRFINDIDKLNPGGVWTTVGQTFDQFSGDRPHRREVEQTERWIQFFGGARWHGIDAEKELISKVRDSEQRENAWKGNMRRATSKGAIAERKRLERMIEAEQLNRREISTRLREVRNRNALARTEQ